MVGFAQIRDGHVTLWQSNLVSGKSPVKQVGLYTLLTTITRIINHSWNYKPTWLSMGPRFVLEVYLRAFCWLSLPDYVIFDYGLPQPCHREDMDVILKLSK
jgi:hypothetical protein